MSRDLAQHYPFFSFKTKQNVSKSKLDREFAKKGWSGFSCGFSDKAQETSFTKGEIPQNKKPKIDSEVFKRQILKQGCVAKPRKPIIEHKEADFFTSKAEDFASLIEKKCFKAKNQKASKTLRCANSVFLEVQNIQDSFKRNEVTPTLCLQSHNRNFIADFSTKKSGGQENVPSKTGCHFIFQENVCKSVSIKKVEKTNVFSSFAKTNSTVTDPLTKPITNSSNSGHGLCRIKGSEEDNKVRWMNPNQNKIESFLEDESSKSKGSSWLQSLHISDADANPADSAAGKKRIRNILPGGFAEQLLKLQRIEKSEEVIWDHNVDRSKKKRKYLRLVLISVSSAGGIVIAKCQRLPTEGSKEIVQTDVKESNGVYAESSQVVVLLKKNVLNKLHLKVQSILHLYPPWQTFYLPLISCPIILCAKFMELNSCEGKVGQSNISWNHPTSLSTVSPSINNPTCFNEIYHEWGQPMSLSGRIQRIWKVETSSKNVSPLTSIPSYFRYSLLIQEQNAVFYMLMLPTVHFSSNVWKEFISRAEGKCYRFRKVFLIGRFCSKKQPQLFKFLNLLSLSQVDGKAVEQKFCYQLAFHSSAIPEVVCDDGFPAHCPVSLQPLSHLLRDTSIQRFNCIAKVIFQFKKKLYLCDDSVSNYVQLESLFPVSRSHLPIGCLVLIRDAQLLQGCLFLDNYSSFLQISEESQIDERFKEIVGNRLDDLKNTTIKNVIPSINERSESSLFVFVEGEIVAVDANNALSWLQCNMCFSENLVQDSRLVIYCENCLRIVLKPVLSVKMSVTCQCSPQVKVEVELLSRTIKGILQIDDNAHQPHCNVEDVLGRQVGPLLCFIRSCAASGDGMQFLATEVDTS